MDIEPDTKDWTWVLSRACPECGFEAGAPERSMLAALSDEVAERWAIAMHAPGDAAVRPAAAVWSRLEYGCHVRDVLALASERVRLMLEQVEPTFANWDQDATAIADDYAGQEVVAVASELTLAARGFSDVVAAVPDDGWERTGLRGDGAMFTVESFTRYLLHDPIHHLTDITGERWT